MSWSGTATRSRPTSARCSSSRAIKRCSSRWGIALARIGRLPRALEVLEDVARQFPDYEPAYCHRIAIYAELGRHEQAEEMFYLAQELDEDCPHCFFHMGASLAERGETERAIFCWQRVLTLDADYLGVRQLIAQAFRAEGKLDEARTCLIDELRKDPGNTELLLQLGELALEQEDLEGAAAKFTQILELAPEHDLAQVALGRTLLGLNKHAEALAVLERAHGELLEDDAELETLIGEALVHLGRHREARDRLQRLVEDDPENRVAQMRLGHALVGLAQWDRAGDCYRRVLAIEPTDALAYHNLAVCSFQAGRWEVGLEQCQQALKHRGGGGGGARLRRRDAQCGAGVRASWAVARCPGDAPPGSVGRSGQRRAAAAVPPAVAVPVAAYAP